MGIALGASAAVLVWVLVAVICVAVWVVFTLRGLIRTVNGTGGPWASVMAQVSIVAMAIGLLRNGTSWGIGAGLFPPALLLSSPEITELAITRQIAFYALPATIFTLGLTLYLPRLRPFAIVLTGGALLATTLTAGEAISARAMCTLAADQGLTNITRYSFVWSIPNTGYDFQFDLHAMAQRGEDHFGWSYGQMDWYLLPDTIWNNVQSGAPACDT